MSVFYFAWVEPEDTAWSESEHLVEDEDIQDFELTQSEGEFATLKITVRNPSIGPLHASRMTWCWFSIDPGDSDGPRPLFFGELIAVPTDIAGITVEYVFRAAPADIDERKAALAETLRVLPYYDPIFLDLSRREDPDAVLEGYASLWHVDRVTHEVTISSVTQGEDGTETFGAHEVPVDSVSTEVGQSPQAAVGVDATVTWQQRTRGYLDLSARIIVTWTGQGLLDDWPQSGASLGGGWTAIASGAFDHVGAPTGEKQVEPYSWSYQNKEEEHNNGDTLSASLQLSDPEANLIAVNMGAIKYTQDQAGFLDPFHRDKYGDPAPINIPMSVAWTYSIPSSDGASQVRAGMVLQYDADRTRSERLMFVLDADLQPLLGDAEATQDAIVMSDVDVGAPLVRLRTWYAIRNTAVSLGDVIFPDYHGFSGMKVGQVVVTAGVTGEALPDFSPILGELTSDGTAVWSSLGPVDPNTTAPNWPRLSVVQPGTLILPSVPTVVAYSLLVYEGMLTYPTVGVQVNVEQIVRASDGSYQVCATSGTTAPPESTGMLSLPLDYAGVATFALWYTPAEPAWSSTWGDFTTDGSAVWMSLGTELPSGRHYHLCVQGGTTGDFIPPFDNGVGGTTDDGTVQWVNVGEADLPIGGYPGNTPRAAYFPTDRGQQSLEYLICCARAKLLYAARAVKVTFDCRIERAIDLSCRKNAILEDPRLPGGQAFGKITEYTIKGGGDGDMRGSVTIGCTIGRGNSVTVSDGTPTYVEDGYVEDYQQRVDEIITLPGLSDIAYTPPVERVVDDGVTFPLTPEQAIIREFVAGTLAAQQTAITEAQTIANTVGRYNVEPVVPGYEAAAQGALWASVAGSATATALAQVPIYYELELRPMTGVSFGALYSVATSTLVAPRHIDLEAPP